MSNYKEYGDLLSKTYDEAVEFLLQKYGSAQDDYFREKSYQRFMDGEIKNITKGKYSRTGEGLYCHHIDERKYLNISNKSFIKENKYPFESQKKERLVYCDLIEHTILHVLIAEESSQEFGYPGYLAFLKPIIEEWYIDKKIPKPEWMKNCYHKSFLMPEESVNILKKMQKKLGESYYNTPFDYYESKQKDIEKEIVEYKKRNEWQAARLIEDMEQAEKDKEREKQIQKERIEKFYYTYPEFNSLGILFDTPRRKVIALLYDYKYKDTYKSKKELDLAMKPIIKDELLQELYLVISNFEDDKR